MYCGMPGMLMSIFTDFVAFKSSLSQSKRNIWFSTFSLKTKTAS